MLTKRQKEVLNFVKKFINENEFSPSLEEIKKHLDLSSVSTAHHHVKALEDLGLISKQENSARAINVSKTEPMLQLPILGVIAAGSPIEAIEQKELIAVPRRNLPRTGNLFALRVAGTSMVDENIDDGDIVIIKEQSAVDNGQKAVALIDGTEVTLKKIYRDGGQVKLQPANQNLQSMTYDAERVTIQGLLVDVVKSPNQSSTLPVNEKFIKKSKGNQIIELKSDSIVCGDCMEGLKNIPSNSIAACITDPPYNYEFIGHTWNDAEIQRRTERVQNSKTLIKYIPYGSGLSGGVRNSRWYKRNAENIQDYQDWTFKWGREAFRVLKPGAYILVFNSTRTIAHVQVALEKCGFYARDIIVWRKNSGIPKGLNFVKKLEKKGAEDAGKWAGWHSCLRNEWEAIALLQKPLENNYLETVKNHGVSLLNAQKNDGSFLTNIIEDIKRDSKDEFNIHCTVKPTSLISKLIKLVVPPDRNNIVLDPFMGSGTTAIAAIDNEVSYLGYEINKEYCDIALKRIKKYEHERSERLL